MGQTERDKALLANPDAPKELRFFMSNFQAMPVARVAKVGEHHGRDEYAYVDPDSVPEVFWDLATDAMQRMHDKTGVNEVHGAVDMYIDRSADEQPLLMEFNVKEPDYPSRKEHPELALRTRKMLINQLLRMAGAGPV
jgi:hypothetical protein